MCNFRSDHGPTDPFFSSGSECGSDGQVPDGEKMSTASKAKIYPMERGKKFKLIWHTCT